jgi:hypothetical protein
MIVVPGAQQSAANQVVYLPFLSGQTGIFRRGCCGNDGVVIRDLGIVNEPPPQWALPGAGRKVGLIQCRDRLDDPRQRYRRILRQMPAVGSRFENDPTAAAL